MVFSVNINYAGFMLVEKLGQILNTNVKEILSLMKKFEVVLQLDDYRLLIPSLLPPTERQGCLVFSKNVSTAMTEEGKDLTSTSGTPPLPLTWTPYRILARYYLLPFIPHGFFPRMIARIMSSNMIDLLHDKGSLSDHSIINTAQWKCWRDGIVILFGQTEIFRIAKVIFPLLGTNDTHLISSEGETTLETYNGIEIIIAILPETTAENCSINPTNDPSASGKGLHTATRLLHQATTIIDSVFEDWYQVFARRKGLDANVIVTANPCPECFKVMQSAMHSTYNDPTQQVGQNVTSITEELVHYDVISSQSSKGHFYMFTSPFCARAVKEGMEVKCPAHGEMSVDRLAPDMVFSDFPPSIVFNDPTCLTLKEQLGHGGFGSVFKASLDLVSNIST